WGYVASGNRSRGVLDVAEPTPRRRGAFFPVLIGRILVAVVAAAPFYLPIVRSDQDKLDAELRPGLQRISGELTSISANLSALADLRKQLESEGVKFAADVAPAQAKAARIAADVEKQIADTAKSLAELQRKYPYIGTAQPLSGTIGGASGLSS